MPGRSPACFAGALGTVAHGTTYCSVVTASDLTSPKAAKPGISFTFCVDSVTLSGYTYDSGANTETCDSF